MRVPAPRPHAGSRGTMALLALILLAAIVAGYLVQPPDGFSGYLGDKDTLRYVGWALLAAGPYLAAVALVRYRPDLTRGTLPIIVGAAILARILPLAAPPPVSTDIYRYVWDGRVQNAGISPYRYLPADPALEALRHDKATPDDGPWAIWPNINRADTAPTIYPPAAQALFAAVARVAPTIGAMKLAMVGFDLLTLFAVIRLLRAAARPPELAVIWAWNPLVIWEFAGAGHLDAMAAGFIALALLAAARSRQGWAAAALAVAILTKLLPALLFPAIWRPLLHPGPGRIPRWNWAPPAIVAAIVLAAYAAYAVGAGTHVFGYLVGYTREEDMQDGRGFLLLGLLSRLGTLPGWAVAAYLGAGLALLGAAALWTIRRPLPLDTPARAAAVARAALVLAAITLAIMSPHYPWYLTLLVLPACVTPSWAALWPSIAGPLLYIDPEHVHTFFPAIVWLPALALLVLDLVRLPARRSPMLAEGGP